MNQKQYILKIYWYILHEQVSSLRRLEQENQIAAERLEEVVRKGELLLEQIQAALSDIAQQQLDIQQSSDNNTC